MAFLVLFLFTAAPASAGGILVWIDQNQGTSAVPGALTLLGLSATTAAGAGDFSTQLGAGGWDLVIFGEQNTPTYPSVAAALGPYVTGGGKVLGATWLYDSGFSALMQASYVGNDVSPIYTSIDPIFSGLGATIDLTNPGWGVWSIAWNPTGGAVGLGTLGGGSAVIFGNGGRTLLNGPLFDTYANLAQGQQFVANEIDFLLNGAVPEPSTFGLIGAGVVLLAGMLRRKAGKT